MAAMFLGWHSSKDCFVCQSRKPPPQYIV